MDNGFVLFNHVKIPHINMLARFSEVDPKTNKFVRKASPALVYGTMTWVRSNIVSEAGNTLAQGVTIATRYCAVRRQFQDRDAGPASSETPVLDYAMVQARLLPLLATCYALNFTGKGMKELYEAGQSGHSSTALADLHATSCGLKALSTTIAAEGLEMCRKTCGGHGYSSYSGIGPFYGDYLPNITWEGDNYMLTQQVARYLLKSARAVIAGKAPENDTTDILQTYVDRRDIGCAFDILDNDADIVRAFAWRAAAMTFEALKQRDVNKRTWNSLLIDFWRLSTAHSQYMIVKSFHDGVNSEGVRSSLNEESISVLKKLFRLHALQTLIHEASEFFMSGAVTINQVTLARTKAIMALLHDIRVHAVALVDAWKIPDWYLDSSLGRWDGKIYEDLFARASTQNPLNDFVIDPYPWNGAIVKETAPKSKL
ncbi:fatty-acyl coenzyme A oxidase [Ascosphaera aggregata]|nr:fatty-acyl coenzyme A oxidase [Ascosphaera aggregata]